MALVVVVGDGVVQERATVSRRLLVQLVDLELAEQEVAGERTDASPGGAGEGR